MHLVLHPATKSSAQNFINNPSHALLIKGQSGAGKGALAAYIADSLLGVNSHKITNYPYLQVIKPMDGTIAIDTVRDIQRFFLLKTLGDSQGIRRVLIVEDADALTIEAQNAFLKLLEEPPADTAIILTATNQSVMLPTIRSRAQLIHALPPLKSEIENFFAKHGFAVSEVDKAYHMSSGNAGLMYALLNEKSDHPMVQQIQLAKKILSIPVFERLIIIDQVSKDRTSAGLLLQALQLVSRAALAQAVERNQTSTIKRWHRSLVVLTSAAKSTASNPNLKLLMTDTLLSI